jgi:quinol monooxygenase YgiN
MVRLTISLVAASARGAQELLDALRFLGISTRLEPGCLRCSAWTDPDLTVRYVEDWATEADMRRRVRSERFTHLLAVVESAKEPQVQFDFVTSTRGLDYVAQVRDTASMPEPAAPPAARAAASGEKGNDAN